MNLTMENNNEIINELIIYLSLWLKPNLKEEWKENGSKIEYSRIPNTIEG